MQGWKLDNKCDWCDRVGRVKTQRGTRYEYSCFEHFREYCREAGDTLVGIDGYTVVGETLTAWKCSDGHETVFVPFVRVNGPGWVGPLVTFL